MTRFWIKWVSGWVTNVVLALVMVPENAPFGTQVAAGLCLFGVGWFMACAVLALWDGRKESFGESE